MLPVWLSSIEHPNVVPVRRPLPAADMLCSAKTGALPALVLPSQDLRVPNASAYVAALTQLATMVCL